MGLTKKSPANFKRRLDKFKWHHGDMTRKEWANAKKEAQKKGTMKELLKKHRMSYGQG